MASKKSKKVESEQKMFLIIAGLVGIALVAIAASIFGYSIRTAVYKSSAVYVSYTPRPTPTPSCVPLSNADVQNITNQINHINNSLIPDDNKKVAVLEQDIVGLSGSLTKLEAALKSAKDQNTKKFLQQQINTVTSQILGLNQQVQALQQQIQQLHDQIVHLHDLLSHNCNNVQGSPTLAP